MSIYQGNQLVAGCITASVPTGSIIPFAGSTAPTGFLLCDGSAVSRTTYSALYDVIGTTYGEGDGNTTFNLPNFTDRWIAGNGTGYLEAGLPNITGSQYIGTTVATNSGCFATPITSGGHGSASGSSADVIKFDASRSNSIYGNSTTVQPVTCKVYFIIRY